MTTALDGDWTADKVERLEADLLVSAADFDGIDGGRFRAVWSQPAKTLARLQREAATALQQQRLMLAAANARIAELEAWRAEVMAHWQQQSLESLDAFIANGASP